MEPRYLLDTNIASRAIKRDEAVLDHLAQVPAPQLAISVITEAELRFGLALLPEATRLKLLVEEFMSGLAILSWRSDAARQYALLRAALQRRRTPMRNLDLMIGSHALALGLTLVTNDQAFRRIETLSVEDWTKRS